MGSGYERASGDAVVTVAPPLGPGYAAGVVIERRRAPLRRVARALLAVTVALAACVTIVPAMRAPRVARARMAPTPPAPWHFHVIPTRPSVYAAGTEDDGAVDVISGGLRVRASGSSVEWARDLTLMPIVAHARERDQWLFASYDGALFRSEGFTGALTRLGDGAGPWLTAGFDSTGTLAVRGTDGALWLGGVHAALHRVAAPADGPLVDSGFIDPAFGLAVVAPGQVFRTLDGGAHFDPVDVGGRATYVVYPNPDAFVLQTTGGLMRVERDGAAVPFTGPTGEWSHTLPDETLEAIRAQPVPWSRHWFLLEGGVLTDDRSVVMVDRNRATWLGAGGDRAPVTASVDLPGFECTALAWGARAVAMCLEDPTHAVVVTLDADHTTREMQRVAPHAEMVASLEGTSLAVDSPCNAGTRAQPRDETPVCIFDGGTWLARSLPSDDVRLLGIHGDRLLYEQRVREDMRIDVHVRDIHDGTDDRVLRSLPAVSALTEMRFTSTGGLVGLADVGGRRMLAIGAGDTPLDVRPLPDGVLQIGFVDGSRGVAVGADLGSVWTTGDGGRTWTPASLGIDGDATHALVFHRPDAEGAAEGVRCGAHMCTLGERLLWAEPGILDDVPTHVFAAVHPPTGSEDDHEGVQTPRDEGFQPGTARCETTTPTSLEPRLPPFDQRIYGGNGWAEPHRSTPQSPQGGGFAFAWGGTDARGLFESHARPAVLPPLVTPPTLATLAAVNPGDEGTLYLRYAARDLAVFERCVGYIDSAPCDLVIAPRGGVPRLLASQGALLDFASAPVRVRSVMPLADGGVALHVAPAALSVDTERRLVARVDMVVVLDRRGVVVQQRGYAWEHGTVYRMLARTPEQGVGLAVARVAHPRELAFLAMAPQAVPHPLVTLPASPLQACGGDGAANQASSIVADQVGYATAMMTPTGQYVFSAPANVRSTLEIGADGSVCLRNVSFWSLHPADETPALEPLRGVPQLEARNGVLQGTAHDRRRTTPLRCEFQ